MKGFNEFALRSFRPFVRSFVPRSSRLYLQYPILQIPSSPLQDFSLSNYLWPWIWLWTWPSKSNPFSELDFIIFDPKKWTTVIVWVRIWPQVPFFLTLRSAQGQTTKSAGTLESPWRPRKHQIQRHVLYPKKIPSILWNLKHFSIRFLVFELFCLTETFGTLYILAQTWLDIIFTSSSNETN